MATISEILHDQQQRKDAAKKKPKRDPVVARRIKEQLEAIWEGRRLTSPFLKALWSTTKSGDVYDRENKEKIREYTREE